MGQRGILFLPLFPEIPQIRVRNYRFVKFLHDPNQPSEIDIETAPPYGFAQVYCSNE